MRVSQRGQITIPKQLREQFGLDADVEIEITPTEDGLLIRKCRQADDPLQRVSGILGPLGGPQFPYESVDAYIDEVRGRTQ